MHFDAVIIGDGPAGSLTAFMLAKAGFNVALYTSRSSSFVDSRPGETLPSAAGHLLNDLGLRHLLKFSTTFVFEHFGLGRRGSSI